MTKKKSLIFAAVGIGLALFIAAMASGCAGTPLVKARQATTVAGDLGLAAGKSMASVNEQQEKAIADKLAATHDVPIAKVERDMWRGKYNRMEQAVKTYALAVLGVRASVELAASHGTLDLGKVMGELATLADQLRGVLGSYGVTIGGVK